MFAEKHLVGYFIGAFIIAESLIACSTAHEISATASTTIPGTNGLATGSSYMAPLSAEEHAIALFNTEIFLGTISSAGTPIQVSESGSEAIYVPVDVEISEAFRGTGSPSTTVRLRMLSAGTDRTHLGFHDALPLDSFQQGAEILVFGGDIQRVGNEPTEALTPNMVLLSDGPTLRSVIDYGSGNHEVDRQPFLDLLRNLP
jgi:hypothetical protein